MVHVNKSRSVCCVGLKLYIIRTSSFHSLNTNTAFNVIDRMNLKLNKIFNFFHYIKKFKEKFYFYSTVSALFNIYIQPNFEYASS